MTETVSSVNKGSLINSMLGKEMSIDFRVEVPVETDADTVLEVRDLRGRFVDGVSFQLRRGEILGLAGLAGSGREEIPYALAGALNYKLKGQVRMPASGSEWRSVGDTGSLNLAFVPADRGTEGIIDGLTVAENLTLSVLGEINNSWFMSKRSERRFANEWATKLQVKMADSADPISTLSGGNQQKVLIGRCLITKPDVLILSEPTAGVDIGARRGIFELLTEQAGDGLAVIIASTDLDDMLSICSRVLVFQDGVVTHELEGDAIKEDVLVGAVEGLDPTEVHRVHI
jgi:ribose transport system ATP-binding protein